MDIELFDGDVEEWNHTSTIKTSFENSSLIRKFRNDTPITMKALNRIGSDSTMAQVFEYNYNVLQMAIKILPILSKQSLNLNIKEIDLSMEVSLLVERGRSRYFPLVYHHSLCNSTFYYQHETCPFKIKSCEYQKNYDLSSNLLFSELAYTDLKNFVSKNTSPEFLNEIIGQVFEGIHDLQMLCNIVHNDLHLGNILLLHNPTSIEKIHILIHDFGRSIKVKGHFSNIQKKTDLYTFLREIRKSISNLEMIEKIQNVIELLDDSTNEFPILDVIEFWK